jgi:MFS family permease
MYDYYDTATFLTDREKDEVRRRLETDRLFLDDKFKTKYIWDAMLDCKIWTHMFITIGIYSPLYSFSLFLPTIIKDLGYSAESAQLMSAPPYVVACFFCITVNWLSDRWGQRGYCMIVCNITA